jgi:hypothetical protein
MEPRPYQELFLFTNRGDVLRTIDSLEASINNLCNSILTLVINGEVTIDEEQKYPMMICGNFEGIRVYLFKDHMVVNDFRYQIPIAYNRMYTNTYNNLCELYQEQNNNKNKENE